MFVEIDDGVLINLDNVFRIQYKPYNNRGAWVFIGTALTTDSQVYEQQAVSRQFNSREEARTWLKNIFYTFKGLSVYFEGSAMKEDARKRKPLEGF